MWLTTGTTTALARARNDSITLASAKRGTPQNATTPGGVSTPLEALAAVIPTGIAAFYTGAVLVIRGAALDAGSAARAVESAQRVKAGGSVADVHAALENVPLETTAFIGARWFLLGFCLLTVGVMTLRSSQAGEAQARNKRKLLLAEPLTAAMAFVGWSLASPGTPLAVYYGATDVLVYTALIGAVAGLTVLGSGAFVLKNPVRSPQKPKRGG